MIINWRHPLARIPHRTVDERLSIYPAVIISAHKRKFKWFVTVSSSHVKVHAKETYFEDALQKAIDEYDRTSKTTR